MHKLKGIVLYCNSIEHNIMVGFNFFQSNLVVVEIDPGFDFVNAELELSSIDF